MNGEKIVADTGKDVMLINIKNELNKKRKMPYIIFEVISIISLVVLFIAMVGSKGRNIGILYWLIVMFYPSVIIVLCQHARYCNKQNRKLLQEIQNQVIRLDTNLQLTSNNNKQLLDKMIVKEEDKIKPPREFKECPMCAEMIRYKAKLCRFCGHEFGEGKGENHEQ